MNIIEFCNKFIKYALFSMEIESTAKPEELAFLRSVVTKDFFNECGKETVKKYRTLWEFDRKEHHTFTYNVYHNLDLDTDEERDDVVAAAELLYVRLRELI